MFLTNTSSRRPSRRNDAHAVPVSALEGGLVRVQDASGRVEARRVETGMRTRAFVEVSAPGVDKASGLAALAAELGVAAADVLAFGDMPNDLPMLRWAGTGWAVANGHDDVRAVADRVCGSNDDDGVARELERLL